MKKALLLEELTPPFDQATPLEVGVDVIREPGLLEPQQLIQRLNAEPGIEGVICPLGQQITREVFKSAPQLKVVSNIAVGLDNIDLEAARAHHVRIAHTPHVLTDATADLTWALLLGASRRIVEADRVARSGSWKGWEMGQLLGRAVGATDRNDQKTLGVIGLGEIGQAIANRASGFNMRVVYHSRTRRQVLERERSWSYLELDDLLRTSDYIILALALHPETRHIINRERLAIMKPDALLINIGRGALIDEVALIDALSKGRLGGAALDVFEREPLIPEPLRTLTNVTLTPHIGSATIEARQAMSKLALDAAVSVLLAESPRGFFVV